MELIVTSREDLQNIVESSVRKIMNGNQKDKVECDQSKSLSIENAVDYLLGIGCVVSKSQLYKATMQKTIPFKRFGSRRIIFDSSELKAWAEGKIKNGLSNQVTKAVSKSAGRKLGRTK